MRYRAIIDKLNLVAVAVVVELSAVVTATVLRTVSFISGKAGKFIEVLIGNSGPAHHYRVGMVQLIRFPVNNSTLLAIQSLDIVTGAFGTVAFAAGYIEVAAAQRHYINTRLIGTVTAFRGRPVCTAVAALGPLSADVSTVLGSDREVTIYDIAASLVRMQPAIITTRTLIEVNIAHIPLVVHIDDGASVTRDGLLLNLLGSKSLVRLGSGCCQVTGGAGLGFGFLKGELIIVHILLPVNHCVLGIGVALPVGGEGNVIPQGAAEGERGIPVVPALEGIAHPGGSGGFHGIGVGCHEFRGDVGAAVGIIGDPVALRHLGVEGDVGVFNGDGAHLVGKTGIGVPAGDGLVSIHGECNIGVDGIAGDALLGGADHALRVQEEHIVHGLELGIIVPCGGSGDGSGSRGEEAAVLPAHPAGELEAILLGRGGSVDMASVGHILGVLQFPFHIEIVRGNRGRGVLNIIGIHALHGAVENLHVVGAVRLGAGEGRGIVAAAVAQEGLVIHDLHIALHSGDGEGEFLGLLIGGEGHGIVSLAGLELTAQSREVHVHGQGDGALLRGIGGLGGLLGRISLYRGVVHVDGPGGVGVGAGENRLVLAVGPRGHGGGEGVALHLGDIGHEGLLRLPGREHQILIGDGVALLAVGVDSTKHHSQLHAGLRFCGFCGLRGSRGLRRIGGSLRALRGIGPGGSPGRTRGIPGLGRGFYSQGLRGGAALRGLGGAGFGGFLPTAPRAAAGQQPSGGVQDAGGQDDGNRHDQGQDTGM